MCVRERVYVNSYPPTARKQHKTANLSCGFIAAQIPQFEGAQRTALRVSPARDELKILDVPSTEVVRIDKVAEHYCFTRLEVVENLSNISALAFVLRQVKVVTINEFLQFQTARVPVSVLLF